MVPLIRGGEPTDMTIQGETRVADAPGAEDADTNRLRHDIS